MKDVDGQTSLFAQDGSAGRTSQGHSRAGRRNTRTSGSYWKKSLELKAIPFMSLDLTPGHGNLLGEFYWELISPWLGGSSMLNTGPAPLNAVDVYSLSQILEGSPHRRYYLSRTACLGILRRASERGKELPPQLKTALMMQAGLLPADQRLGEMKAYHTPGVFCAQLLAPGWGHGVPPRSTHLKEFKTEKSYTRSYRRRYVLRV